MKSLKPILHKRHAFVAPVAGPVHIRHALCQGSSRGKPSQNGRVGVACCCLPFVWSRRHALGQGSPGGWTLLDMHPELVAAVDCGCGGVMCLLFGVVEAARCVLCLQCTQPACEQSIKQPACAGVCKRYGHFSLSSRLHRGLLDFSFDCACMGLSGRSCTYSTRMVHEQRLLTPPVHVVLCELLQVSVTFQLPCLHGQYHKKADHYISHLVGHEGPGSLLSALKVRLFFLPFPSLFYFVTPGGP